MTTDCVLGNKSYKRKHVWDAQTDKTMVLPNATSKFLAKPLLQGQMESLNYMSIQLQTKLKSTGRCTDRHTCTCFFCT